MAEMELNIIARNVIFRRCFVPLIAIFSYSLIFMLAGGYSPLNIFVEGLGDVSSLDKFVFVLVAAFIFLYAGLQMEKRLYKNSI